MAALAVESHMSFDRRHWHGIELKSFYDGVGDWSGYGTRTAPPIAPGDSFVVRTGQRTMKVPVRVRP